MKQKNCFFLTFIVSFFSLFLLFSNVNAIVNENDVNFSWITTIIYDDSNPSNFNVDDTLNLTTYNGTDYYEHVENLNSHNYTNFYYTNGNYLTVLEFVAHDLVFYNDTFYVFKSETINDVEIFDVEFNSINNITNSLVDIFDVIESVARDDNYFYVFGYSYPIYKVVRLNNDLNYVNTILQLEVSGLYKSFKSITYFNNSIYIGCHYDVSNVIFRYDLVGNLLETIDISSYVVGTDNFMFEYYMNHFYLYDKYYDDVDIFSANFTHLSFLNRSFSNHFRNMYIKNDLVFYIDDFNVYLHVLNLTFESKSHYDICDYYPHDNGFNNLFDGVSNLNFTVNQQTALGFMNSIHGFDFDNDTIGTNPSGWTVSEPASTNISIESLSSNNTAYIDCESGTGYPYMSYNFGSITSGMFDYWIYPLQVDKYIINEVSEGVFTSGNYYSIACKNDGHFGYYGALGWSNFDIDMTYSANTWYHLKLVFNTSYANVYVNDVYKSNVSLRGSLTYFDHFTFRTINAISSKCYFDNVSFSWYSLDVGYVNSIHNEWNFTNDFDTLLSIEFMDGSYFINDVNTTFDIYSQSIGNWSINIDINQLTESGILRIFNESNYLLYSENFSSLTFGYIQYIKYSQYYIDSDNYVYISNTSVYSNDTMIYGSSGFLSYVIDLVDVFTWVFSSHPVLTINAYGRYRFYLSNDTYGSENAFIYPITSYIDFRDDDVNFNLKYLNFNLSNPHLIVETINGLYKLNNIKIAGSSTSWTLYDNRGYFYNGNLDTSNINVSESNFYILSGKLYFQITYDDSNEEYMQLTFDIENINNENYQLIYSSFLNDSSTSLINQIILYNFDGSSNEIDLGYLYCSDIEILNQDKITSQVRFLISDVDTQDNKTISGYINGFTFNYSGQITISLFTNQMIIMLIPLIIILSFTFGITYVLKDKKKESILNKSLFFPIFFISSILVFIFGFYDTWILFVLIIAGITYYINKKG